MNPGLSPSALVLAALIATHCATPAWASPGGGPPSAQSGISASGQSYLGSTDSIVLNQPGCNATAFAQMPGNPGLFAGRQLLTADGRLAPPDEADDCSGGNPDNARKGKAFNLWSLTLVSFDWTSHRFGAARPLLDTSIDPMTGNSRAIITRGSLTGARIRSAYDPSVALFRGRYYVAFECIIRNTPQTHVQGTSVCLGEFDPARETIDLSRTNVVVSGIADDRSLVAAAVPRLLVFGDRLYLYWSALVSQGGRFASSSERGAALETTGTRLRIAGSGRRLVRALDPLSDEVWSPDNSDALSDTLVNVFGFAAKGGTIYAFAALGGSGCLTPSGRQAGCFRLSVRESDQPLGRHVFNHARKPQLVVPTNPQEYALPIRDPEGRLWLMGHFIRPTRNGASDLRPMPGGDYWESAPSRTVLAMAPLPLNTE